MFIFTDDYRLINTAHLTIIRAYYSTIEAYTLDEERITLGRYETEKECCRAFERLAQQLTAHELCVELE